MSTAATPQRRYTTKRQFTATNIISSLDHHGYCILEHYLTQEDLRALRHDFKTLLPTTPTGRNRFEGSKTQRCYSLFQKTRALDHIVTDPLLLHVLAHTLGSEHCLLSSTVGINIGTNEEAQVPHRDDGKYPVPRVQQQQGPELVMNMIIAVDDFSSENGGTVLYEGSHRWQYEGENNYATQHVLENTHEKHKGVKDMDAIKQLNSAVPVHCEMPAGSIMLYRGSLLHGGGANRSTQSRLGILLEFIQAWLRPQETHLLGVDRDVIASLPVKLQEMLGWTVTPPFIGYVDGRHPKRLLSKV